jgi:hypothetical protein
MKNYKLKALSLNINNRVYRTEDGFIFNEQNTDSTALKNAVDAGFLIEVEEVKTTKKTK